MCACVHKHTHEHMSVYLFKTFIPVQMNEKTLHLIDVKYKFEWIKMTVFFMDKLFLVISI